MIVLSENCTPFFIVDAFTTNAYGGNPAGVVPNADEMSTEQMLRIAKELNLMEVGFVSLSRRPKEFNVRYFTIENEIEICGHAAIATFTVLWQLGRIILDSEETKVYQNTKAGTLPVEFLEGNGQQPIILISLPLPLWIEDNVPVEPVSAILGIPSELITQSNLPVQIVHAGIPDLLVPIPDRETLFGIKPDFSKMKIFCEKIGCTDFHLFTQDTVHPDFHVHVRNLFPFGQKEESATGTANGALSCYLVKHGVFGTKEGQIHINIEQGYCMNRPSSVRSYVSLDSHSDFASVRVGGQAVVVAEGQIIL